MVFQFPDAAFFLLVATGLTAGFLAGLFSIGGGVVLVPALIYVAGFTQHTATGTSLAVLLAPVGIGAVWEYHRHGRVNVPAAIVIAVTVAAGALLGAVSAHQLSPAYLRLAFSVFVLGLGVALLVGAVGQL